MGARRTFGKMSKHAKQLTGEHRLVQLGASTRMPDAIGECRISAQTGWRTASHVDGPEPTDWPYTMSSRPQSLVMCERTYS